LDKLIGDDVWQMLKKRGGGALMLFAIDEDEENMEEPMED
jgi:hypothetical protein